MKHNTTKLSALMLAAPLTAMLFSCQIKPEEEEDSNNVTRKFNSTWNIYEKQQVNEDGSITYKSIPWGGLVGTFLKNNAPMDLSAYESITFEYAEPTTVPTQVVVQDRFKTWGKEGITSLTCNFDGQDVSAVEKILFQTGDSSTIHIKKVYLTPSYGVWESTPIWSGECRFGDWENGFMIKPEKFEQAYEGDKIEFIFTADNDDPNLTYWLIKTIYSGTSETLKGNDYELNSYGCAYVSSDANVYRIVLTADDVVNLREKGLFSNGYHLNITQCNLLTRKEADYTQE